jgi:ABC-type lipoprotein export system ATPase subunit
MSLLALERVGKRYREGQRERIVLDDVSLEVEAGELVVV